MMAQPIPEKHRRNDNARRQLAAVRLTAVQRVHCGETIAAVARDLGLHRTTLYGWLRSYTDSGETGLDATRITGRKPKLTSADEQRLWKLLRHRALWTRAEFAELLKSEFSLELSRTAIDRLLGKMGVAGERLQKRLQQRNGSAINQWLAHDYETIRQQAKQENAALLLMTYAETEWATGGAGNRNTRTLSVVSPKGVLYFTLHRRSTLNSSANEFIHALTKAVGKRLFLLIDNEGLLDRELQTRTTKQFLEKHSDIIKLIRLPDSSRKRTGTTVVRDEHHALARLLQPPAQTDMGAWSLLIEKSLLDNQPPFSSFLEALSVSLGGPTVIAANLQTPGSLLRSNYPGMNLDRLITLNQVIAESWHTDPFLAALAKPGDIYTEDEIISRRDWMKNRFYRQALRPARLDHTIGLCFAGPEETLCGLFASRPDGKPVFTRACKDFLRRLRPHLESAMALAVQLWRNSFTVKALEEATDHMEIAALVLDGHGKVIKASGAATEMLSQKQRMLLNSREIHFANAKHQQRFEQAVAEAIAWRRAPVTGKPVEAMRFGDNQGEWIGVLVQPITPPSLSLPYATVVSPHVIVYITDSAKTLPTPQHQLIMRLFNLSHREAYLTMLLTDGKNIHQAAKTMGITPATARTYLQHIYDKTGVNRRQDLIQRVMKSVVLLA